MTRGRVAACAGALGAAVWLLNVAALAAAQELPTDAERLWHELRDSSDVRTKLLADRWYHIVKLQEWSDDTGKFTANAKYLAHDPKLAWVKLRVVHGTGRERAVKEVTIPLTKLSKTCQARVRQIHLLSAKLAEAKTEEEKRQAEDEKDAPANAEHATSDSATLDGGPIDSAMPEGEASGDKSPRQRGVKRHERRGRHGKVEENPAEESSAESQAANPLAEPAAPAATPPPAWPSPERPPAPAAPSVGAGAWRTNYDVFRANIRVHDQGNGVYTFEWGPMQALQRAYEIQQRWEDFGSVDEAALTEIGMALAAVGEVTWEATLKSVPAPAGDWNEALDLSALPAPWELTFVLDESQDPAVLATLKPGDRVKFTGRFAAFDDTFSFLMPIRFAAVGNQPVSGPQARQHR